jgi:hypothetical protein
MLAQGFDVADEGLRVIRVQVLQVIDRPRKEVRRYPAVALGRA